MGWAVKNVPIRYCERFRSQGSSSSSHDRKSRTLLRFPCPLLAFLSKRPADFLALFHRNSNPVTSVEEPIYVERPMLQVTLHMSSEIAPNQPAFSAALILA